jgi:cell division protein FtsW
LSYCRFWNFISFFCSCCQSFSRFSLFSRVTTWESRIENFSTDKPDEDDYQIEKAKIAIASGKIYGLGPGKSVQKNFCRNPRLILFMPL